VSAYDYETLEADLLQVITSFAALPASRDQLVHVGIGADSWVDHLCTNQDYIDHGEYGLAYEGLVDDLTSLELSLPSEVLHLLRSLAIRMELDTEPLAHLQS